MSKINPIIASASTISANNVGIACNEAVKEQNTGDNDGDLGIALEDVIIVKDLPRSIMIPPAEKSVEICPIEPSLICYGGLKYWIYQSYHVKGFFVED